VQENRYGIAGPAKNRKENYPRTISGFKNTGKIGGVKLYVAGNYKLSRDLLVYGLSNLQGNFW
jgi:hypothetical protein